MLPSNRKSRFIVTLALIFFSIFQLKAQTDSLHLNPISIDTTNIKSGDYLSSQYKPQHITNLATAVNETSGLLFLNGEIWTNNDSGNKPEIYQIDSANGNILRTVLIRNSMNTDWESITQDDANVYIGDFGNNGGKRTDLHILKISKNDLQNPVNDTLQAGFIHFSYPDQTDFATAFNKNNFDCEAFFYHNDSLHLFSKNWLDQKTKHYVLPVDTGNYKARLAEQFNADGLITDASINAKGNVVLLGYKNTKGKQYTCFAWLFSDSERPLYFGGTTKRVELGSALHLGQTEGIVLKNDNSGWISSESIRVGWIHKPAKLFSFDFGEYFDFGE